MIGTIRTFFQRLATMNPRIGIGGGGLALLLAGQGALTLIRPFA